jgi:dihydrodipicolinate synthase/N-acetylneuraminate lyase
MSSQFKMNRRALLGSALGLTLGSRLFEPRAWGSTHGPSLAPADFKSQLRGPIVSIPTPFTADFQVDHAAARRLIHQAQAHGMRIFDLTAGDGQFAYLSYEEIKALTATVVKAVDGKGIAIAGTGPWWTGRAVDYARYAESVGATAVQVLLPKGASEEGSVEHFRKIASATRLPIVLHGKYSDTLLQKLSPIESIVALKEDVDLHYLIHTLIHFGNRYDCFAGGSYEWLVAGQPYGCKAYFDAFATFYPEISERFWAAVQKYDVAAERNIIEKYENSFIWGKFSHSFWHATLEYFGIAKRYLRPPVESYSDAQMKDVKAFFDKLGLYPQRA